MRVSEAPVTCGADGHYSMPSGTPRGFKCKILCQIFSFTNFGSANRRGGKSEGCRTRHIDAPGTE